MTKRMLIDASHPEETRVVVMDGNRLDEFDLETAQRRALKGNIYLAKVVRVEPSLQAAFVEYGGNRHGFLAFGEIHPDYYQIPVADRQRLLEMQEEEARAEDEADLPPESAMDRAAWTVETPEPWQPAEDASGEATPATEAASDDAPAPEAVPEPEAAAQPLAIESESLTAAPEAAEADLGRVEELPAEEDQAPPETIGGEGPAET
ncbi:MAG: ribonuclease E/G, partial [Alphaproteobacteria bacterium]